MGGFVLENFLIKKEGRPENAYRSIDFSKNARRFLPKTKSPRKRSANFLTLVVEKPLTKVATHTSSHDPFTAKTGHLRQT